MEEVEDTQINREETVLLQGWLTHSPRSPWPTG